MIQEKLVCVKRLADGMPFKMGRLEAQNLIKDKTGEFQRTSKSYTKSYYRRMAQTLRNQEIFKAEKVDFSTKQSQNFVEQEGNKIIAWRFRGNKTISYEIPEDPQKAEEKHTWLQNLIEKACRNPHDQSIKAGILSKIAIFFGFLKKKEDIKWPKEESIDLPKWQRYTFGYGDIKDLNNIKLA